MLTEAALPPSERRDDLEDGLGECATARLGVVDLDISFAALLVLLL